RPDRSRTPTGPRCAPPCPTRASPTGWSRPSSGEEDREGHAGRRRHGPAPSPAPSVPPEDRRNREVGRDGPAGGITEGPHGVGPVRVEAGARRAGLARRDAGEADDALGLGGPQVWVVDPGGRRRVRAAVDYYFSRSGFGESPRLDGVRKIRRHGLTPPESGDLSPPTRVGKDGFLRYRLAVGTILAVKVIILPRM
ncbi:hypothetical protein THAOC_23413, partial [Thalassiosira oceanica]